MAKPLHDNTESILLEAQRITHGDRNADYGHPLDDYTRTAALVSGLLAHKLMSALTADEMALVMVCVKLSRQIHRPKRDNMVDGAGYFWVAQACLEERERRKSPRKLSQLHTSWCELDTYHSGPCSRIIEPPSDAANKAAAVNQAIDRFCETGQPEARSDYPASGQTHAQCGRTHVRDRASLRDPSLAQQVGAPSFLRAPDLHENERD